MKLFYFLFGKPAVASPVPGEIPAASESPAAPVPPLNFAPLIKAPPGLQQAMQRAADWARLDFAGNYPHAVQCQRLWKNDQRCTCPVAGMN